MPLETTVLHNTETSLYTWKLGQSRNMHASIRSPSLLSATNWSPRVLNLLVPSNAHMALFHWTVRFTFGGFSTGYSTWYFFSTTSGRVPSDPYHYQNVTCKLCWSLIGRRTSSLLRHWTCDTRPNKDPLDLNQHRQRRIGRTYQPNNICWGSTDVPLVYSRGADPARAEWKSLMYIFRVCFLFIFLPLYLFYFN